jgi:beta-lactamase class A
MKTMLTKKVPLYLLLLTFFVFLLITIFGFSYLKSNAQVESPEIENTINPAKGSFCNLNIGRLKGYQYIHPLLYAEPKCESEELADCKNQITQIIDNNIANGKIISASVYVREFTQAQWISINPSELYSPGSLLKVPELMALYKMNEIQPGFLDKTVEYNDANKTKSNRVINFESKQHIKLGNKYTVRELIKYMIVYSDNDATMLLNELIDKSVFSKIFTDIGLKDIDYKASDYKMNVADYSIFLKELYNGSYLNFKNSEECLSLLSKTEFKDGIISGLPANCVVCHKFGEGGPTSEPNFSEGAIVYCGRTPYIISIMTKGKDMKLLPAVSAEISKKVYQVMSLRP